MTTKLITDADIEVIKLAFFLITPLANFGIIAPIITRYTTTPNTEPMTRTS